MLYLELQFTTARFAALFHDSVRALDLTPAWSHAVGPADLYLDRISAGPTTFAVGDTATHLVHWTDDFSQPQVTAVDAPAIGVEQQLVLGSSLLIGRGTTDPTLVRLPDGHAALTMTLQGRVEADGKPHVVLSPTYVTAGLPPIPGLDVWNQQALEAIVADRIEALIPEREMPIPLKRFADLKVTMVDVGVATDANQQRLAIRFQSLPAAPAIVATWQEFHAGDFVDPFGPPLVSGGPYDWAAVVDEGVAEGMIRAVVEDGLRGRPDFQLISGVGSKWQGAGPQGHIAVDFYGKVTVGAPIDPGATVHSDVTIAAKGGQLESRSVTHATLDKGDALLVSTLINIVLPVIGIGLEAIVSSTMSGTTLGGVADTLLVGFIENEPIPFTTNHTPSDAWTCVRVDDATLVCTRDGTLPLDLGDGRKFSLQLDDVMGLSTALVERGHLSPPPPLADPAIEIQVDDPRWQAPSISCAESGSVGPGLAAALKDPLDSFLAKGAITVISGPRPVTVFQATLVSGDPANVVAVVGDPTANVITITFKSNASYEAAPYRFAFVVQTTAGVRLVWLDRIPQMTDEVAKGLVMRAIGWAAECFKLVDPFYEAFHRYNPKWSVDPEIGARPYLERAWGLFVEHLPQKDIKPIERMG